nr:hypothetical protein [Tanacetum cinerariifolium]
LDTFYNALNPADQDSLNAAASGNLLEKSPQDALTIIENKSKQTSAVTTAMTAMLKQFQSNSPPAQVKAVEEICVTCEGAHLYYQCLAAGGNTFPEFWDNIQGYVSAATCNFNQGNPGYRPQGVANQMRPLGAVRQWLEKEPPRSITTWDDLVSKFINEFFPPSRTTNLHQDSLNAAASGNLLEKSPQDALTIIENKSKQTSAVTTAMTAMLKQFQSNPPPAQVKAVEEICVTCEGNPGYRPQGVANQIRPPGFAQPNVQNNQNRFGQPQGVNCSPTFNQELPYQATQSNQNFHLNELEKIKRMNDVSLKAMQNQIDMVKNELRNEMKTSIQTSLSNQTNEIKNMMANLLQMNTASTLRSGVLPGNTIANPKGELKAITTRIGLVTEGPIIPNPPKPVNPEEDKCIEETYMDPDHAEYNIKVPPPPPVQKPKPSIQRNFIIHTRDSLPSRISYPSRMLKQKQQEKYDIQIQKFWNMFKQLHLNITLAEALVLMPKY